MDRVFLDANVLFSAAYDPASRIAELWALPETELVTSCYAAAEALHNVADKCPARLKRLDELLEPMGLVPDSLSAPSDAEFQVPAADRPILAAAIGCRSTPLLTGDKHFGPYFGRTVGGTLVLRPGDYLLLRKH